MSMTKREQQNRDWMQGALERMGFTSDEFRQLRRISMTLSRWAERECGDGSDWAIERDEQTGKPYLTYHGLARRRIPIADREGGALRRLAKLMEAHPACVAYHQPDCRGAAVYVIERSRLTGPVDSCYTHGIAVY